MGLLDPRDPRAWRPAPDLTVEERLRMLEDWRLETRTTNRIIGRVLIALFGTSVISTTVSVVGLVQLLFGHKA